MRGRISTLVAADLFVKCCNHGKYSFYSFVSRFFFALCQSNSIFYLFSLLFLPCSCYCCCCRSSRCNCCCVCFLFKKCPCVRAKTREPVHLALSPLSFYSNFPSHLLQSSSLFFLPSSSSSLFLFFFKFLFLYLFVSSISLFLFNPTDFYSTEPGARPHPRSPLPLRASLPLSSPLSFLVPSPPRPPPPPDSAH